ncbi:4-hydroxy-tetrahydrodipicolinate reductase [Cupriavidus taiwanensis]|uniref:4-hydroxy-tetrahydrodipicolinate reductase n=1 Tax=Cupriavidus taiwanensis TaxID=164546 RepID=UPI0025410009|nr:4-hydroxy-tetrahydrodipicolinate reductase [Cupriavidus taiwanensis]MDK3023917.1 4-hydroxy-tetrahydrodipicolinate reductase [Cupriavidus taiwanensis]
MNIAIAGASGRMGRMLIEQVLNTDGVKLSGALDLPGSPALGQDAGLLLGRNTGVAITSDLDAGLAGADCLIDFTRPEGTLAHLAVAKQKGIKMVIGTTGFDEAGKAALAEAARSIGIVYAANFSVGVNATFKLLEVAAKLLSTGYDIEVIEAHHRFKVDAPSGTALKMGEVIADALGRDLKTCAVYAREGHTGERDPNSIGFATIRGGDIVGDHTVMFAGIGERIEISHKSSTRQSYADGAVRSALFLAGKPNGLFDMQDVLGLK